MRKNPSNFNFRSRFDVLVLTLSSNRIVKVTKLMCSQCSPEVLHQSVHYTIGRLYSMIVPTMEKDVEIIYRSCITRFTLRICLVELLSTASLESFGLESFKKYIDKILFFFLTTYVLSHTHRLAFLKVSRNRNDFKKTSFLPKTKEIIVRISALLI